MTDLERARQRVNNLSAIADYIDAAKGRLKYGRKAWMELDLAEARLWNLGFFASLRLDALEKQAAARTPSASPA